MSRIRTAVNALQITDWLALALLLIYVVVFSTLTIRQHQSFNTNALDLGKFDQSIWNTAQGRPFQITISENLVIESHFSPSLALFAPLYWIWSDIRLLFIMQSILLGGRRLSDLLLFPPPESLAGPGDLRRLLDESLLAPGQSRRI